MKHQHHHDTPHHSYRLWPKLLVMAIILMASLWVVSVYAQADVNNPSALAFTASADHALVDSYEADILRPDGTVLQTLNLGKPTPDATSTITAPLNVQPIAFAVGYSVRVRAKAGTAVSDYALSANKFNRVPGAPSKLTLK